MLGDIDMVVEFEGAGAVEGANTDERDVAGDVDGGEDGVPAGDDNIGGIGGGGGVAFEVLNPGERLRGAEGGEGGMSQKCLCLNTGWGS
jgi:hypothetical protein